MGSVLVINCGSSSAKLALYSSPSSSQPSLTALAERLVSEKNSAIKIKGTINKTMSLGDQATHHEAIQAFITVAGDLLNDLQGIGHRVVHGGEVFHKSTVMDEQRLNDLRPLSVLAPLHNPANIQGIELCQELFPQVKQVAVFDTSFHQTIPESTYMYGTPYAWYEDYGVRRYGFHGTSFRYVTAQAAKLLNKPVSDVNLLIAHLGNGCSAAAIRNGQSVDTTMGLTPLEGLVMGTRTGDIDPGLIDHMLRSTDLSFEEVMRQLNRESGLKGISGLTNDMRTLLEKEAEGHERARKAIDIFCFRMARHFSALSTSLPYFDAVVFTGGIGENSAPVRQRILDYWQSVPFTIDDELNSQQGNAQGRITTEDSPLAMVVETDEEGLIAIDTYQLTRR